MPVGEECEGEKSGQNVDSNGKQVLTPDYEATHFGLGLQKGGFLLLTQ